MYPIEHINPDELYITSIVSTLKYSNGTAWTTDFYAAQKQGKIKPVKVEKIRKLYKGSDVIRLWHDLDSNRIAEEQTIEDKAKNLSTKEIIRLLKREKKYHKARTDTRQLARVTEERDFLLGRLTRREDLNSRLIEDVRETLMGNKQVHVAPAAMLIATGVYFLFDDDEIVYVGKSVNILSRVTTHINEGQKVFNKVRYIKYDRDFLDDIEMLYIKLLKPKYNGTYKHANDGRITEFTIPDRLG